MAWYDTGASAEAKAELEEKKRQERAANGDKKIFRYFLPVGKEGKITIVDDNVSPYGYSSPFMYRQHQLNRNGKWDNFYTCIEGQETADGSHPACPLCQNGERATTVFAYTVIDNQPYVNKKGETVKDIVKLFICKSKVHKLLQKQKAKRGGSLRGCVFEVSRTEALSPSTGDYFEFVEHVTLDPSIQPVNYLEELAPEPVSVLKALVGVVVADDDGLDY